MKNNTKLAPMGGRLPLKGVEAIPELFDVHVME